MVGHSHSSSIKKHKKINSNTFFPLLTSICQVPIPLKQVINIISVSFTSPPLSLNLINVSSGEDLKIITKSWHSVIYNVPKTTGCLIGWSKLFKKLLSLPTEEALTSFKWMSRSFPQRLLSWTTSCGKLKTRPHWHYWESTCEPVAIIFQSDARHAGYCSSESSDSLNDESKE